MSNQEKNTELHYGVCDVHKYALNDASPRMVYYCSLCDADICEECSWNAPRRALAATNRALAASRNAMAKFWRG